MLLPDGGSLLPKSICLPDWSLLLKGDLFLVGAFCLIGGNRTNNQSKKPLPVVVGWQPIHLFTIKKYKKNHARFDG